MKTTETFTEEQMLKHRITKIIFIFEIPFDQRNFERFGIQHLLDNGFKVEIWDVSHILHPQNTAFSDPASFCKDDMGIICKKMLTKHEVTTELLQRDSATLVNCIIRYSFSTLFIYRTLSKKKIPYAITVTNAIPLCSDESGISNKSLSNRFFQRILFKKGNVLWDIIDYIVIKFPFVWGVQPATLCYAGGEKSIEQIHYPLNATTKILWLHTLDYDTYLKVRELPDDSNDNIGVFLDEYLSFHPDFALIGETPIVTADDYYRKICTFFDYLEKHHNIRILIAAHPRSDYEHLPDYFEGRQVIKGKTAELVRKSRFVITHASTSINFAILFQKPIMFLTMDQLKQDQSSCQIGYILENMCSLLKKKPISLDRPFSFKWDDELVIHRESYERYKKLYIKTDHSPEMESWKIITNYLKNKF